LGRDTELAMRHQQQLPPHYELRRQDTGWNGLTVGMAITAVTVGAALILLTITFVADWLRTPTLSVSATSLFLSPNGDQDHDSTTVSYSLSEEAAVTAEVLGEGGGLVRTLVSDRRQPAGQHFITWDGLSDLNQPVADGRYRLQVTASGPVRTASQGITLQVDSQPPALRLVNLPDGLRVREPSLVVQGLTDTGVTVWVTGNPQPMAVDNQGRFSFQPRLVEGSNQIEVRSVDAAGNTARLSRQITVVTTPPEVVLATPVDDEWTNQSLIVVSGQAPSDIKLKVNDQPVVLNEDGSFQYDLLLEEGDNLIRIAATDDVGNVTTTERLIHLKTKPPLLVLDLEEGTALGDAALRLTGRTDAGATVAVNGQVVPVSALGDFEVALNLFEGDNLIQAEARDQAGNVAGLTRRIKYSVSQPAQGMERLANNLAELPSFALPLLLLLPLILLLAFHRLRPVALVLSVDRRAFTPGVPGEGKVLVLSLDLSKGARVTLEVLDQYGRPLATVLRGRRRNAGEQHFFWDGYDDYGRPVPPGEYVIQAVAGTPGAQVTSAVHVTLQEDVLVHGRGGRRAGEGEVIDGRADFVRRRSRRRWQDE
jgi:flagellar hook assembly protein FlgD